MNCNKREDFDAGYAGYRVDCELTLSLIILFALAIPVRGHTAKPEQSVKHSDKQSVKQSVKQSRLSSMMHGINFKV